MIVPLLLSVLFVFSSYLLVLSRHNSYIIATLQEVYKETRQYYYAEGLLSYGIALYKAQGLGWDFPVTKQVTYGGDTGALVFTKEGSRVTIKAEYQGKVFACIFKARKDGTITLLEWHKEESTSSFLNQN